MPLQAFVEQTVKHMTERLKVNISSVCMPEGAINSNARVGINSEGFFFKSYSFHRSSIGPMSKA